MIVYLLLCFVPMVITCSDESTSSEGENYQSQPNDYANVDGEGNSNNLNPYSRRQGNSNLLDSRNYLENNLLNIRRQGSPSNRPSNLYSKPTKKLQGGSLKFVNGPIPIGKDGRIRPLGHYVAKNITKISPKERSNTPYNVPATNKENYLSKYLPPMNTTGTPLPPTKETTKTENRFGPGYGPYGGPGYGGGGYGYGGAGAGAGISGGITAGIGINAGIGGHIGGGAGAYGYGGGGGYYG